MALLDNILKKIKAATLDRTNLDEKIASAVGSFGQNVVKPAYQTLAKGFNTMQDLKFGKQNPQTGDRDFSTSLIGQGIDNYRQNLKLISNPETQGQFTENAGPVRQYITNRYLAPLAQIPRNTKETFGSNRTLLGRARGALGLLGGYATLVPDPIQDVAMPAYDYIKGVRKAQSEGESTPKSYSSRSALRSLTGEEPVGLGDITTQNPAEQGLLNLAEIPLTMLVAGGIRNNAVKRQSVLAQGKRITELVNGVSLIKKGVIHDIAEADYRYAESLVNQILPNLNKSSVLRAMKDRDPKRWLVTVTDYLQDALVQAKNPKIDMGLSVRKLQRLPDTTPNETINPRAASEAIEPKKPQTLNVRKLNLTPEGQAHVSSLEGTEPKTILKNKDVVKQAEGVTAKGKVVAQEDTAQALAKRLANRQKVVTLEKQFQDLKAKGGDQKQLESLTTQIARASRVARSEATDAGRTLQAQTILADEMATPMQKVFRLLDNAGVKESEYSKTAASVNWDDANQVVSFYRKFVPAKFGEWLDEYRYTNMLSSPRSWISNVASNVIQVGAQPVRKTLAGGYDRLLSTITGRDRQQFASEAIPFVKKAVAALPNAWNEAKRALKGEQAITNLDYNRLPSGSKFLQKYSFPSRIMEAGDMFFRNILESGQKGALEYRGQRTGKMLDTDILDKSAKDYALETLFRGELDKKGQGWMLDAMDGVTRAIGALRNNQNGLVRGAARVIVPFLQTPMNILKQGVEYSPLEFVNMIKSKGDAADQLAKATIGSMVMTSAGLLAASGNMTWDEPNSTNERAEFYAAGKQKYSIKLGDKWVSYSKLGPLAYPLAMAGAVNEALKTREGDEQALVTAGRIVAMVGGFFTDQSYMQSIGDLIEAAQGNEFKQTRILSSVPQQLVPMKALFSWVSKMVDPIYRKVDWKDGIPVAIAQSIQRDIPFASQSLPAYETPFGEESKRQYPVLNSVLPFTITKENPEENRYYEMQQARRQEDREQRRLKEQLKEGKMEGSVTSDKRLKVADAAFGLTDIKAMPEGSAYEKALKRTKAFTKIDDIMDSKDFSEDEKIRIVELLGISSDEAEYYNVARQGNDAKLAYVQEALSRAKTNGIDPYTLLSQMRQEVNNKMILANEVIDDLKDAGAISADQAKALKKLKYNKTSGQVESSRNSGSSKTLKSLAAIFRAMRADNEEAAKLSQPSKRKLPTALSMVLKQGRKKPSADSLDRILSQKRSKARKPIDVIRGLQSL